jgi:hypothetical protein
MTNLEGPNKKAPTGDYPVGFARPPREHQFKKGQSGNASGRPRGSRSIDSVFGDLFRRRTTIRIGSTEQRVPMIEALGYALLTKGLKGDTQSLKLLFGLFAQISEQSQNAAVRLSEGDQEILADLERRLRDKLLSEIDTPETRQ